MVNDFEILLIGVHVLSITCLICTCNLYYTTRYFSIKVFYNRLLLNDVLNFHETGPTHLACKPNLREKEVTSTKEKHDVS